MATWFDKFKSEGKTFLKRGKDIAVSSPLASFLINRTKVNRYGELKNLRLDSFKKTTRFSLLLIDEDTPIDVALNYETKMLTSGYALIITSASISRKWMDKLVQRYALNKEFPVPKELYNLLN